MAAPPGLSLQPLPAEALAAVVALHRLALPATLNSRLGADHLSRLYQALQRDAACHVQVAVQAGQVVGVVSVTLDPAAFVRRFMAQQRPRHWLALAAQLVRRPSLLRDWRASQALNQPVYWQGQPVQPCLSAIAVAAGFRRQGVGQALAASVDGWVRAHHHPAYYLDTQVENHSARAFYRRLGLVEVEQRGDAVMLVRVL